MTVATLHRLPQPAQPRFDDEQPARAAHPAAQAALPLRFELPSRVPFEPAAPPHTTTPLEPMTPSALAPRRGDDEWAAPRRTGHDELPDARSWAGRLAQALLEVVVGDRPAAQLLRWTTLEVHQLLVSAAAAAGRGTRQPRGVATVRTLRVSAPADGVAEAAAVVVHRGRARAFAFRLEGQDGRWRCTALQWA